MKLLYKTEHLACFQYKASPVIERIERIKGKELSLYNDVNKLVFVIKGRIKCSFDNQVDEEIRAGDFFFVPSKSQYKSKPMEDTIVLLFRLNLDFNFCDHFTFESLFTETLPEAETKFTVLNVVPPLKHYLEGLEASLLNGVLCSYYMELKQKELLFLLRVYYSRKELQKLFTAISTSDVQFSNKVYENCDRVRSSKELANLMHYSPSGFEKRFKRVFGQPAYQWMKTRKARNIYHEINCTKKTFSEIAYEFGFSSASYFTDFCKANFGRTPGVIRKQREEYNKI